jgi:hypothetical protein
MTDGEQQTQAIDRDGSSPFGPANCYVAFVGWEYEDNLPKDINKPHFDAMFEMSRVDGVRLYPFIEWEGKRIYLAAT